MLQWEWPVEWDPDFLLQLRQKLERALVRAMASGSSQISGRVEVADVCLGSSPPQIRVNSIQDISASRTSITFGVKYDGDASLTLRGLRINLGDMCSVKAPGSLGEDDANHALPLHIPFEVRIHKIHIEGEVALEFDQTVVELTSHSNHHPQHHGSHQASTSLLPSYVMHSNASFGRKSDDAGLGLPSGSLSSSSPSGPRGGAAATSSSPPGAGLGSRPSRSSAGCGIVFPGGGARRMRQPDTGDPCSPGQFSVAGMSAVAAGGAAAGVFGGGPNPSNSGNQSAPHKFSFFDVVSGHAQVRSRTLRLQFFGDPLKNFAVESNLDTMRGTREKVEGTLKKLVRPAIEAMMMNGVEFKL
jgi:hypothetical protein